MKHATFSPSSAHRWIACPGSIKLCEGIKDTSSVYADEGTAAHFLLDQCLLAQPGGNDKRMFGAKEHFGRRIAIDTDGDANWASEEDTNTFKVDLTMIEAVNFVIEEIQTIVENFRSQGAHDVWVVPSRSLSIEFMTGEEGAKGTADFTITALFLDGAVIYVGDFKYGMGVEVHAEENEQCMMYALAAAEVEGLASTVKEVVIGIHQPRLPGETRPWALSSAHAEMFITEVKDAVAVASTTNKGDDLYPAEDTCRFCPARATCPALYAEVSTHFGDESLLPASTIPLGLKMSAVGMVEDWCKAVRAKVESELLDGREVEGWKLVQGKRGNRGWKDEDEAEAVLKSMRLKSALKMEEDPIYTRKLVSPTVIEKLIKKVSPKRWARVSKLVVQADGKPSVAPASDPRPALSLTMEAEFEVISDSDDLI